MNKKSLQEAFSRHEQAKYNKYIGKRFVQT